MNTTDFQDVPWYEAAFDELYPILYPHRDEGAAARETENLVALLELESRVFPRSMDDRARIRVLDACCGSGRHTVALRRTGFDAWGCDLSISLLREAARHPELRGRLVKAEIRALPFRSEFQLVLNLFTSFGYFQDDAENRRALESLARVAAPGGLLVVDHMNPPFVERNLVPFDEQIREGYTLRQRRWIDKNRILKNIDVLDANGRHATVTEDVRLYRPEEMRSLFAELGLEPIRLFGSFSGAALTPESDRMIAVGRKPER